MFSGHPISLKSWSWVMKPSFGSAMGRASRIRARADSTVWCGYFESKYAMPMVTERDLPIALSMDG